MIQAFDGPHRFLSNFYPCALVFGPWVFPSAENAYQAAKSNDPKEWELIRPLTAAQAKRAGQKVTLRPDWNDVKLTIMEEILQVKFQIPHLKQMLINTGTQELVEGNYWGDVYWGVCKGKGENHLGKLLMKIRSELQ